MSIILHRGFHSVCLNEVVQEMNVLKGSFYPHFQSTGNCDVGVLMHQPAALNAYKRGPILLDDAAASPRTRLFTFFTSTIASFLENGSECLRQVVKLASEVSDFSEPMQKVLAAAQRIWAFTTEQVFQQCTGKPRVRGPAAIRRQHCSSRA